MKKLFFTIISVAAISLPAATMPRGDDRLRELVVFPEMNLTFHFGISFQGAEWVVDENTAPDVQIEKSRFEVKRQPDNPDLLLRLGGLLDNNGETNDSQICYEQAEQLARKRIAASPQNGPALTTLGRALWALDHKTEAESVYRRAVLVSSNDWHCWVGLGTFLACASFPEMFPENLRSEISISPAPPALEILDYRPSADALQKAEAARNEAARCFGRAIALAPREPDVFFQYAGFLSVSNWQDYFFRHYRDNDAIDSSQLLASFFSSETTANLEKAADLKPDNYELTAMGAYFEWSSVMFGQPAGTTNYTVEMMPDKARKSIHAAMTRLENLSGNADKKTAAGALESHGFLSMTFGNIPVAIADCRRAVALDPTREAAWDMLLGLMRDTASPEEVMAVCQERVKSNGSARNHLLLAKFCAVQNQWGEAADQAETAGKLETNNIVPVLLMAAVGLKQSAQTNYLAAAGVQLLHAGDLLKSMPATEERTKRWREFVLDVAIYNALVGQPDVAKTWLNEVLKGFPDDATAEAILQALD